MAKVTSVQEFRTLLRRFERVQTRQLEERNCCSGLTFAQCHPLLEIGRTGETTTTKLSQALGLDKSTLSRTIEGLVKAGIVRRETHPKDRRYYVLSLTREGRNICDTINRENDIYYAKVFDLIPETDHANVIACFGSLVDAMQRLHATDATDTDCCN